MSSWNNTLPHNASLFTVLTHMRLRDSNCELIIREDSLRVGTLNLANPRRRSNRENRLLDLAGLCGNYETMYKKNYAYSVIGILRYI
jgi:hypothetical protein